MLCRNIGIIDQGEIIEDTSMKELLGKLNVETFVLDMAPMQGQVSLHSVVARQLDDHTLEVDVPKSAGLNSVFAELSEQGHKVLSMRNKANRLEELFVHLVEQGRQVEESA